MAGGYVAYEEAPSGRVGAGSGRRYWLGPGGRWAGEEQARTRWAPRFASAHDARAALVAAGVDHLEVVGYEWVPGTVEQQSLFPVLTDQDPVLTDGAGR